MPKYAFQCPQCGPFNRTLKIGNHQDHPCPVCHTTSPRVLAGQGFGFAFAQGGSAPANSGVSKHDYPTADQVVGSSADARWEQIQARDAVKKKVREVGGNRALIRREGAGYVEYEAGTDSLIRQRKQLVAGANKAYKEQGKGGQ